MTPTLLVPTPLPPPPPATQLLTAEAFCRQYENRRTELVKGIVKELPMPQPLHGRICARVTRFLDEFTDTHDLGRVMSNDSFVKVGRDPDTVRGADVCFFSYERLPRGEMPEGLLDVVPELVVEVRSPSETWTDIIAKVHEYLSAGVQVVIVLNPPNRAVAVYRSDREGDILRDNQELTVPDLLPGFAIPVRRFFE